MINPIGHKRVHDAYVGQTGEAAAAQRTEQDRAARAAESAGGTEGSVQVSAGLRRIQAAVETVKASPDIRVDVVERLREQIQSGQYHVSSQQLAAKLLGISNGDV